MNNWIWLVLALFGGLFVIKMMYALSVAVALPRTRGALYVSTSRALIHAWMRAVPMGQHQVLMDLGCGDGRVLREACKRYGVRAIGYEVTPLAYIRAKWRTLGHPGIEVRFQDFWKADLSRADVVFCYLFPDVLKPLYEKIKAEVRPGAVVISANFSIPNLIPSQVLNPGKSLHNDPIYIYKITQSGRNRPMGSTHTRV